MEKRQRAISWPGCSLWTGLKLIQLESEYFQPKTYSQKYRRIVCVKSPNLITEIQKIVSALLIFNVTFQDNGFQDNL